jgi:hypothetical protein
MNLVFTICSNNYLAQAIVLGYSLLKYNPAYKLIIGLVDRKQESFDYSQIPFEILEVERIEIPYFDELILKYDIVELNTSVKPSFFKYLFLKYKPDSIIYLDPDIEVFSAFSELETELLTNDIIITPHFTTPINDDKWQAEEDFLNSGLYNLGFIAIKHTLNGLKMVDWWADRLKDKAFIDYKRGLFTDQIWINFVPLFFEKVKIFTNVGYNVAYWNLHERTISRKAEIYYVNEAQPLRFYHYASFRPLNPGKISIGQRRFTFEDRPDIVPLFSSYCERVFQNHYNILVQFPCYFIARKEKIDFERVQKKIKEIPRYKRAIGKILRKIITKLDLVMDYRTLKILMILTLYLSI